MRNRLVTVALITICGVLCSRGLPAATLLVPSEYSTIQEAVDMAQEGDTVILSPGVYREAIQFQGPNITLRSENPEDVQVVESTVMEPLEDALDSSGITLNGTESDSCRVAGLKFRSWTLAGVDGRMTQAQIVNSIFEANAVALGDCNGLIEGNLIVSNEFYGLLYCDGVIRRNVFLWHGEEITRKEIVSPPIEECDARIEGNLIAYNHGGGIKNSSATIINNTIFGNRAVGFGGSNYVPLSGGILNCTGTILNNILWGNTADGEPSQIVNSITPEYCCIEGWNEGGVGNLFTDPRFVDPDNGDLRLSPLSYLIDSGVAVEGLTTDLDGAPRPATSTQEARGDGSHIDIGAYEVQGVVPANLPPAKPNNLTPADGAEGLSIGPVLESTGFVDTDGADLHAASQWQADDQSEFASPEYDSGTDIDHLTRVRAFGGSLDPDTEYHWRVRYLDSRLAWGEWSDPTRMRLEELHALFVPNDFPTVQAAVDDATEGETIVVRGGRYFENVILPGVNLHLRSVDPNDKEVVEGTVLDGKNMESFLTFQGIEGPQFVLEGFTFTNGYGNEGGAIRGDKCKATILANSFIRNSALIYGGAIYQCDGLIEQNRFLHNDGRFRGGALSECNGEIRSNLFAYNKAAGGGAAEGCDGVFWSNIASFNATSGGGGAFRSCEADFYNNVIFGNDAGEEGAAFRGCFGDIVNNTIYGNREFWYALYGCSGTIRNNIIYQTRPVNESSTPTYSLLVGTWNGGGEGNLRADPLFVDPDNGDFRLRPDSPCIDAGGSLRNLIQGGRLPVDYDGKARPVQGVNVARGDGSLYDMGAYEFHLFDNYLSDIDGNLKVNYLDLFEFEPGWHKETDFAGDPRNLNGDTAIDALDLFVLMNDWGVETGP